MAESIVNPRRAPRAPARCRVVVTSAGFAFDAETEDVGPRGCQIVAPHEVKQGETVSLIIADAKVPDALRAAGRIAWASAEAPWRAGIAFLEAALPQTAAWFERLLEAYPGLRPRHHVPDRIPLDATVYLGPPPRLVVDFDADEAALLRAIASGARVDELLARLRPRGRSVERTLFSLFARSAVTLVRGQAAHPDSWRRVLDDVEASLALEALGSAPLLAAPSPAPAETAAPSPAPPETAAPAPAPPETAAASGEAAPPLSPFGTAPLDPGAIDLDPEPPATVEDAAAARPAPAPAWGHVPPGAPPPDHEGKGVGWRRSARGRSPEAQGVFDRARAEFDAGHLNAAIALLRRALQLAPGDSEIAEVLGKLAFRDRDPGAR